MLQTFGEVLPFKGKAIKQYFLVTVSDAVQGGSADEILQCDHLDESCRV